jgi:hypothetical protein
MKQNTSNPSINIPFKFEDKKFEILDLPIYLNVRVLKSLIKKIVIKKVNLKKYNHLESDVKEENILIKKSSAPTVIYDNEYDKLNLNHAGFKNNEEIEVSLKKKGDNKIEDTSDCDISEEKKKKEENENKEDKYQQCMTEPQILRQLIAVEIKSNPELYNAAVLEADPLDYCDWIMRDDTWGGGIELSIVSKCFGVRIDVIDIQSNTVEMIGDVSNH